MKNRKWLFTILCATSFAVGCSVEKTANRQFETVKTEITRAAQDMKDYPYAQKAEFVKAMHTRLNMLNLDLYKLTAKIDGSTDAVKAEARPKLQALRDQATKLNQQLADVPNATASVWDGVKAGTKKNCDTMADGVLGACKWAGDKISS
ncbi:MAG TPA: hypothetical protein VK815_09040 [Candidatus Acidoferrales bacterium]|jgi:hypothetical protein|nr:hypothetical protein [Candidatus Acidoferrales bacterium]